MVYNKQRYHDESIKKEKSEIVLHDDIGTHYFLSILDCAYM